MVTGGAGFIGSFVVDELVAEGHEVLVIDDLSSGNESNLLEARESGSVHLEVCDVCDLESSRLIADFGPEVVIMFGVFVFKAVSEGACKTLWGRHWQSVVARLCASQRRRLWAPHSCCSPEITI